MIFILIEQIFFQVRKIYSRTFCSFLSLRHYLINGNQRPFSVFSKCISRVKFMTSKMPNEPHSHFITWHFSKFLAFAKRKIIFQRLLIIKIQFFIHVCMCYYIILLLCSYSFYLTAKRMSVRASSNMNLCELIIWIWRICMCFSIQRANVYAWVTVAVFRNYDIQLFHF